MKWNFEISDCPENSALPVKAFRISDNGAKSGPFYYSMESFINSLSTPVISAECEASPFITNNYLGEKRLPVLPIGTVGYSSSLSGSIPKERITIVLDKAITPIRYRTQDNIHFIGMPKLILQAIVINVPGSKKRRVIKSKLFAVKDDGNPITNETPLYKFPFPNVNKSEGTICFGANDAVLLDDLTQIERVYHLFTDAAFNEDYGMSLLNGIFYFSEYLADDAAAKPFDDEMLIPAHTTFGNLYGTEYVNSIL